jgi:RHS repeat-associated protein
VASASEVSARRYRYTGKERDEETGLDYFGARYYAPWLGRWTTADPLGLQAGVNLYLYARGSPIVMVDPNGMEEEEWSIGGLVERGIQALPGGGSSGEGAAHISGDAPPVESDEAKRVLEQFREPAEVGIPLEWDFGAPQVDLSLEGQAGFHHENLQQAFEAREARVAAEIEADKKDPLRDLRESFRQGTFPFPPQDPMFEDSKGGLHSQVRTPDGQIQYKEETRILIATLPGRGSGRAGTTSSAASPGIAAEAIRVPAPGEPLYVGTYSTSRAGNIRSGLNQSYTPHHVIQDAASPVTHGTGVTINIPKPLHTSTTSFRSPLDRGLSSRQLLARDVWELRQPLKAHGFDPKLVRQQLQEVIKQNKARYGL